METKLFHLQKLVLSYLHSKMQGVEIDLLKHNSHKKGIVSLIEVAYPFGTKVNPHVEGPFFEQVELLIVISTRLKEDEGEAEIHSLANQLIHHLHGFLPDLNGLGAPLTYAPPFHVKMEQDPLPHEMTILRFITSLDISNKKL